MEQRISTLVRKTPEGKRSRRKMEGEEGGKGMEKLTIEEARRINAQAVTEEHLLLHAANVAACMGAMAEHFGGDREHWEAVGYLHDYDYQQYPDEHLTKKWYNSIKQFSNIIVWDREKKTYEKKDEKNEEDDDDD